MSLVNTPERHPVHFPAKPDKFEFDGDVAEIFDAMALRSIPLYAEMHRLFADMYAPRFRAGAVLCDVGSSTGAFFAAVERRIGSPCREAGLTTYAIDTSTAMMGKLRTRFPAAHTIVGDVSVLPDLPQPADVIACLYVLQFLKRDQRARALDWLKRNLAPGGVLLLGQKEVPHWKHRKVFQETYYAFRRDNGYTQQEIDAKTAALQNAMWPVAQEELEHELQERNMDYTETTRWMQFTSGVVTHRS